VEHRRALALNGGARGNRGAGPVVAGAMSTAVAALLWTLTAGAAAAAPTACPSGDEPDGVVDALTTAGARLSLSVDDDDVGRLRVRLRWTNDTAHAAAGLATLPSGASTLVVTGARVRHDGTTTTARLVDGADADAAWGDFLVALTYGTSTAAVHDGRARAAAVVTHATDGATVQAAGACSARVVDVELDALLTAVPHDGGLRFFVPRPHSDSALQVDGDGAVWIDGRPGRSTPLRSPGGRRDGSDDGDASVFVVDVLRAAVAGAGPRAHGGAVTLVPTPPSSSSSSASSSATFSLVHAALELPRPLVAVPDELRVVFVVDTSVSAGDAGVAAALTVVDAVLDELPADAGWALVTAARRPTLVVPPWRRAHERHRPSLPVGNGSNLDDAVALAGRIAADALPGRGRVIVLSDLQLPDGRSPRLARAVHPPTRAAAAGAPPLVHIVTLPADVVVGQGVDFARVDADEGDGEDATTDGAPGARLVRATQATGGLVVAVDGGGGGDVRQLGRHLVRPTRLDRPQLVVDGIVIADDAGAGLARAWQAFGGDRDDGETGDPLTHTEALPPFVLEGGGLRASWRLYGRARRAALRGWLWGTAVELPLSSTGAWPRASTAAAVTMLDDALADDEVRAAARHARFVSRVTSWLSLPSWRPAAPEGLGASFGCGCCCGHVCGVRGTSGFGTVGRAGPGPLVEQAVLDGLAAEAAARCGSAVDVDVELGGPRGARRPGAAGRRLRRGVLLGAAARPAGDGRRVVRAARGAHHRGPVALVVFVVLVVLLVFVAGGDRGGSLMRRGGVAGVDWLPHRAPRRGRQRALLTVLCVDERRRAVALRVADDHPAKNSRRPFSPQPVQRTSRACGSASRFFPSAGERCEGPQGRSVTSLTVSTPSASLQSTPSRSSGIDRWSM